MVNQMDLLIEIHESIAEFSRIGESISDPEKSILMMFDEFKLNEEEVSALKSLQFNSNSISGIEKIVRDKMLLSFFHFLAVLDGVGDPRFRKEDDVWLGLRLESKRMSDEDQSEEFLHDLLFDAYWKWQEIKSTK